jgi:hypothetical protein
MRRSQHTPAFLAVRDALLTLEDADRRPFARLFGAMQDPQPPLPPAALTLLRAIARLDDEDILRLGRWFRRYGNRWGGIPSAALFRAKPGAYGERGPEDG